MKRLWLVTKRTKMPSTTKKTHQQKTEGASPLTGVNKVLFVGRSRQVILTWSCLFVLVPLELYPISLRLMFMPINPAFGTLTGSFVLQKRLLAHIKRTVWSLQI